MGNVIRLVNGGSIQVRTGVMQGIGPEGPRGVAGPQGQQGEVGPVGQQGPIGQILDKAGRTHVGSTTPVPANTDTLVTYGSVRGYDEISCIYSSTNFEFKQPGDHLISTWLRFDDAGASARELWFQVGSTVLARTSAMAGSGAFFYLCLSYPYRAAAGEMMNVYVRSGSPTQVGDGDLIINRIGSGPVGAVGPPGPAGPQGPQGERGLTGADGDANSGFATYAEMMPHP